MDKIKGQKNGLCNRTSCQSPNDVIFYNIGTKAYYCPRCARHINDFSRADHGMTLCYTDEDREAMTYQSHLEGHE